MILPPFVAYCSKRDLIGYFAVNDVQKKEMAISNNLEQYIPRFAWG